MEARAQLRYARISPRKVSIVLDLIRNKPADVAMAILKHTPKAACESLEKLLKSAIANAENNHNMDVSKLYVAECSVSQGPTLKRIRPRAQGRAYQADTPLGRAKKMADALERGHDEDDLALMFGVSIQTVRATLSLLDATQAVKDAVESGTVTVTQARQLGTLPPEEQRAKVAEIEQATAGTTGHEKARRQRAVLGETKPRLKSRKEITKALEGATGDYAAALRWVLGEAV